MLLLLALIGGILYLLFLYPGDISARQTEGRRIFGAACMTMNNPYYQVLDSCLRSEIEAGGDVLLTRDAAMDQARQNQEIWENQRDPCTAGIPLAFASVSKWQFNSRILRCLYNSLHTSANRASMAG